MWFCKRRATMTKSNSTVVRQLATLWQDNLANNKFFDTEGPHDISDSFKLYDELVPQLGVNGHLQRLLLETLRLQKTGDLVVLAARDRRQDLVRRLEVVLQPL